MKEPLEIKETKEKYGHEVHTRIIFLRHAQAHGAEVTSAGKQATKEFAESQLADENDQKRRFVRFPKLDPTDARSDAGQRTKETAEIIDNVFRNYEIEKIRAKATTAETLHEKVLTNRKLHGKKGLLPVQTFSPAFTQEMMEVMKSHSDPNDGRRALVSYYVDSTFSGSPDNETTSAHQIGEGLATLATRLITATKRFPNRDESDIFLVANSGPIDSFVKVLLEEYQDDPTWKGKELDDLGGEVYNLEPVIIDIDRKDKSTYHARLKYRNINVSLDPKAFDSLEKRRLEKKKRFFAKYAPKK